MPGVALARRAPELALAVIASGCATFHLTQEPFQAKGRKLAVISGLTNPSSLLVAQALSNELGKTSLFQVLSQQQVAQAIPHYPQSVIGPYKSAYFEIDVDFGKTDLARVKELQQHLGVDYLYVGSGRRVPRRRDLLLKQLSRHPNHRAAL